MPQLTPITDTFDICIASNPNSLGAPVVLTVTDEADAQAITGAINTCIENGRAFQMDGLLAFYHAVERNSPIPPEAQAASHDPAVIAEG